MITTDGTVIGRGGKAALGGDTWTIDGWVSGPTLYRTSAFLNIGGPRVVVHGCDDLIAAR